MIFYGCKYFPTLIAQGFGEEFQLINAEAENFDVSEQFIHQSMCGYARAIIEYVVKNEVKELVLTACCDAIKRVYDSLKEFGNLDFLYIMDLPHARTDAAKKYFELELKKLVVAYSEYSGKRFDLGMVNAPRTKVAITEPHILLEGAHASDELVAKIEEITGLAVANETCSGMPFGVDSMPDFDGLDEFVSWYADALLAQAPCMRMADLKGRKKKIDDPGTVGMVFHLVKFCDYYAMGLRKIKKVKTIPAVSLETDFSAQSLGQIATRVESMAERLGAAGSAGQSTKANGASSAGQGSIGTNAGAAELGKSAPEHGAKAGAVGSAGQGSIGASSAGQGGSTFAGGKVFMGIDSGSTSTNVAIVGVDGELKGGVVVATGAKITASVEKAIALVCEQSGICDADVSGIVTTGYGRKSLLEPLSIRFPRLAAKGAINDITEISCHAKGAAFLNPGTRSIIDIGGQDSKVIVLDEAGLVKNFVMNDKCAAGTGRFMDNMARALEMSIDEFSSRGLRWKEELTISNMCTVFAESEVISLVAEGHTVDDIVHALNKSVAKKIATLASRLDIQPTIMMTGGVSKNDGVVAAIEKELGAKLVRSSESQIAGAIGAALFAGEKN